MTVLLLLIGSLALLYVQWHPWPLKYMIPAVGNNRGRSDGYQTLVAFSPDSGRITYCGEKRAPTIIDTNTGRTIAILSGETDGSMSLTYSRDGKTIASVGNQLRIYDGATGRLVFEDHGTTSSRTCIDYSFDLLKFAVNGADGTAQICDAVSKNEIARLDHSPGPNFEASPILLTRFSPDCRMLATSTSDETRVWEIATWKQISSFKTSPFSIDFSPDGSVLAVGGWQGIQCRKIEDGVVVTSFAGHSPDKHVHAVRFFGLSKLMSASCDNTVRVWNVSTGDELAVMDGPKDLISAAVSPDGAHIAACERDGALWVWGNRRPELWYGILFLPAFWMALVSSVTFVVLLSKDITGRRRQK